MMKKKILSLAVVMAMLLSFMPVIAQAVTSGECGDNLTWTLDDNGTLTISGEGAMTDWGSLYVPWSSSRSSIKNVIIGNSVTSIGFYAFSWCSSLESVVIPDSVTSIGESAFYNCSNLGSVVIPDSVTSIGDRAFGNCYSLGSVVIPDSVTSIGDSAFFECISLESVVIPDSVTSIGYHAFWNCSSLKSISVDINNQYYSSENGNLFNKDKTTIIQYAIGKTDTQYTIPDSVTSIGDSAFDCCSSLKSVVIPDSVTSIGGSAFEYCSSLESVTIGNSVTSIGKYAFSSCSSLESVVIPDSVTSIGYRAFEHCSSLESVVIPDSVTSIGSSAFEYCSSLESVVIPDSITSIGDDAFAYCSSLKSVVIPDSVTSIEGSAFYWCSSLTSISVDINNQYYSSENGNLFNKDKTTIIQYAIGKTDTQYTIPDSVTSIGSYAFDYCSSLESVVIPDSVASISTGAFSWCSSLTSISVDINNQYYSSENGNLFNKDKTTIIQYAIGKTDTQYTIPDSVTSIDGYAFWGCSSLKSVVIPDSVTSIGDVAFYSCSSLTDVYYGGSENEWNAISIGGWNTPLTNATIHYNSTGIPSSLDCQTEILGYSESDGKYMINSIAKNNTDTAISCVMCSAVYSSDGTLKACGTVNENIDAGSNKEVDIPVPCTIETGDMIKIFMWADNMTSFAKSGKLVIE